MHLANSLLLFPPGRKARKKRPYQGNNVSGILSVLPDVSTTEVNQAYFCPVRQYHPDRSITRLIPRSSSSGLIETAAHSIEEDSNPQTISDGL